MRGQQPTRVYQNHHLDSTRWDRFVHRPDDIIISTSYKAGTTWMQRIVSLLILGAGPLPEKLSGLSPWIDARFMGPIEDMLQRAHAQTHRRFFKSHLAFDALPFWEDVKYICVGRDTRDVFMSLFNHYSGYTDVMMQMLADGDPVGGPMPPCPEDPRELWNEWITTGNFPWETDGSPYWSHHYHLESFWKFRELPNLLFVHYSDMKSDLETEMRRIAGYLELDIEESRWPALVEGATFESMKAEAKQDNTTDIAFKGGADRFFFKGTNGRWRDVLTDSDLVLYEEAAAKLDADLRHWLENGRLGVT